MTEIDIPDEVFDLVKDFINRVEGGRPTAFCLMVRLPIPGTDEEQYAYFDFSTNRWRVEEAKFKEEIEGEEPDWLAARGFLSGAESLVLRGNGGVLKDCWYKVKDTWVRGRFRTWTTDYEELRDGVGQYPVAIVESLETGLCCIVHPKYVCFGESPPSE